MAPVARALLVTACCSACGAGEVGTLQATLATDPGSSDERIDTWLFIDENDSRFEEAGVLLYSEFRPARETDSALELDVPLADEGQAPILRYREYRNGKLVYDGRATAGTVRVPRRLGEGSCGCLDGQLALRFEDAGAETPRRLLRGHFGTARAPCEDASELAIDTGPPVVVLSEPCTRTAPLSASIDRTHGSQPHAHSHDHVHTTVVFEHHSTAVAPSGYSGGAYSESSGCEGGDTESSGCEGDDTESSGCEGDDTESSGCEGDSTESNGCEGDSTGSGGYDGASSGCEGDSTDSGGCSGDDSGCQGDTVSRRALRLEPARRAALCPPVPRHTSIPGPLQNYLWMVGATLYLALRARCRRRSE